MRQRAGSALLFIGPLAMAMQYLKHFGMEVTPSPYTTSKMFIRSLVEQMETW